MPRRIVPVFSVLLAVLIAGSFLTLGRPGPAAANQASPAASTPCSATTGEVNKELVRRLYEEAYGQGHLEVLDEVLADDYVLHIPSLSVLIPAVKVSTSGQTDEAERIRELRREFSDLQITIPDMVAEGDTVAIRMTFSGTQAAPLDAWGSPNTGRSMDRGVWAFHRIACGRIAEGWVLPDNLTMLRQLGIITDEELADAGTPTVATPAP
jgi:predicted ester cyclase